MGVVENLPVPILMGRDCPLFQSYRKDEPNKNPTRVRPRNRGNQAPPVLPVWMATEVESEEEEEKGAEPTRKAPASIRGAGGGDEPTPGSPDWRTLRRARARSSAEPSVKSLRSPTPGEMPD